MEVIKKFKQDGKNMAWVQVDETNAILVETDGTDKKALEKGKNHKDKKDRREFVLREIKRLKQKYGTTD